MRRWWKLPGIVVAASLLLAGCGDHTGELRFGLVTGSEGTSRSVELSSLSAGMEAYANEHSVLTRTYTATGDTPEDYETQFDAAASDGVPYVIAYGSEMETAVYEAQNAHHDSRYLLFSGEPRKSEEAAGSSVRKNTECVSFNKSEMGFLAGYVPVRDGMRKILFLSGNDEGDTDLYYQGFLNGVSYAMGEIGVGITEMTVNVEFCGTNALSPERLADAMTQYESGTELILTDQKKIAEAVNRAAAASGKYFATIGFDGTAEFDRVSFSVIPDYENAVRSLLDEIDNGSGFEGGKTVELGASDHALMLGGDYSHFTTFNDTSFQTILDTLGNSHLADAEAALASEDTVTSDASGASSSESSSDYAVGSGSSVAVHMIDPTTGNVSGDGTATVEAQTVDSTSESTAISTAESVEAEIESEEEEN